MNAFGFVVRRFTLAAFAFGLAAIAGGPAIAAGDIYVHAGANFKPVTIAVTPFAGEETGDKISGVVAADFARSIFLLPLNPTNFPEKIANPDAAPNMDAWKTAAAQFVLTGRVLHQDPGRVTAQFRLWDTATGEQVAGQQYSTDAANARRVAHMIADAVFSRVTGEKGFFDSRVVFVDETGPKEKRRKRLAVMDMDGANVKYLDGGEELVVTPRFSPSAQQVAYMSFGAGDPKVTLLNLETGQRESVGNFPGMTFAPRFLAGRTGDRDVALGRREHQSLLDGPALARHHAPHRRFGDRHLADLFARRLADRVRIRSRRLAADLRDERERRPGEAHLVRRGPLFDAGLVAARRPHRLHPHQGRPVRHRGDEAGRFGRANPGRGIPQRGADLRSQRPLSSCSSATPAGSGGPKIYMTDIFGHAEFLVPTPNYASDPSWGPLAQ